jgi:hypothetical protein
VSLGAKRYAKKGSLLLLLGRLLDGLLNRLLDFLLGCHGFTSFAC